MANIIQGDTNLFHAAIFAEPDFKAIDFLSNQYKNVSQFVNSASSKFFEKAEQTFQQVTSSEAMRTAKAAARKIKNMWGVDEIQPLTNIEMLQQAKPTMQRYIMAEPTIRELYHQQRVDGYSESYFDIQPKSIGENHSDYRRVMSGIVVEENGYFVARTYYDELTDERDLTIDEKVDILRTWESLAEEIQKGKEDPTSIWCAML